MRGGPPAPAGARRLWPNTARQSVLCTKCPLLFPKVLTPKAESPGHRALQRGTLCTSESRNGHSPSSIARPGRDPSRASEHWAWSSTGLSRSGWPAAEPRKHPKIPGWNGSPGESRRPAASRPGPRSSGRSEGPRDGRTAERQTAVRPAAPARGDPEALRWAANWRARGTKGRLRDVKRLLKGPGPSSCRTAGRASALLMLAKLEPRRTQ